MEMLLTGDLINCDKAIYIGLINKAFDIAELETEVKSISEKISKKSRLTLNIGKKAFYKQAELNIKEAYEYASKVMISNMMAQDSEEGIAAFLEKREPNWS